MLKARKFNNKKKGQALLIVIVISTLALLVLISMADRILLGRVNIQRSAEFDMSVAVAENKLNELIKFIDKNEATACLSNLEKNNYKELTNCDILNNSTNNLGSTKVYGRISSNGYVSVDANNPLTLILSENLNQGVPTKGVVAHCDGSNDARFLITRVYLDGGSLFVDKGIYSCSSISSLNVCRGNVDLYDTRSGSHIKVAGNGIVQDVIRQNTILVSARLLNETNTNVKLDINVYGPSGSNPSDCNLVASTSKYEFIVAGLGGIDLSNSASTGGLGSDVLYYFEKPRGNTTTSSPSIFDYALLSEDL